MISDAVLEHADDSSLFESLTSESCEILMQKPPSTKQPAPATEITSAVIFDLIDFKYILLS